MKLSILATAFAVWTSNVAAIAVTGAAEGFAKGTTGGGNASPVYPKSVRHRQTVDPALLKLD